MTIRKNISQCIEQLGILDYNGQAYLKNISHDTDDVACNMEVSSNNIVFTYDKYLDSPRDTKAISNVAISLEDRTLYTDDLFLKQYPLPLVYTTSKVHTDIINKSDKYFIRMIFKIDDSFRLELCISDCKPSHIEKMHYAFNLTQIDVGKKFELYVFQYNDANFLALECKDLLEITRFKKYAHSIMISLGFISGTFINSDRYIFYSDDQDFLKIRNIDFIFQSSSIKSQFPPIAKNIYGYKDFIGDDQFKSLLEISRKEKFLMDSAEFSKLCNLSLRNTEVLGSIFMLLEANTCSLDAMGSILCVTLESLSNLITKENKDKILPIKNKDSWKKLKHHLCEQLNHDYLQGEDGAYIIKRKIENLNSPTNADKLTKPFDLLDITLSKEDIAAIKNRNNFLHGVFETIEELDIQNNPSLVKLIKLCLRLNFLVSALLLRLCDFHGWVPTYAHIYESKEDLTLDNTFRFIGN